MAKWIFWLSFTQQKISELQIKEAFLFSSKKSNKLQFYGRMISSPFKGGFLQCNKHLAKILQ